MKEHLTKEEYSKNKKEVTEWKENAKKRLEAYASLLEPWYDHNIDFVIDVKSKEFFQCNCCDKITCQDEACCGRKVVCQKCMADMLDNIQMKHWPEHKEHWEQNENKIMDRMISEFLR